MGVSDCPLFPMESNSLPKPTSDFQDSQELQEKDENFSLNSPLTIKTCKKADDVAAHEDEDGSRTPTSSEQRIPLIPASCPNAPRKPKSQPSGKRKAAACRRRILLDLTSEVDSLFPPSILADLGGKMKKARKLND